MLLWSVVAAFCGVGSFLMFSTHPARLLDAQGLPIEATIGINVEYPTNGDKVIRTPPVFVYSPQDRGGPHLLANVETLDATGRVAISMTDLADDGSCTLVTVPVHENRSGASVNYDSDVSGRKASGIQFMRLGREDRIDETAWKSIHRIWWRAPLDLLKPRTRYVVDCPVTIRPANVSHTGREISFVLQRETAFPQLFAEGEALPGRDDTIAMTMFRLEDARDVHFEGRIADTPNSAAAHRFQVTLSNSKVSAQWTDAGAERRRDLLQFAAGALAALGATIVFELFKLLLPLEKS